MDQLTNSEQEEVVAEANRTRHLAFWICSHFLAEVSLRLGRQSRQRLTSLMADLDSFVATLAALQISCKQEVDTIRTTDMEVFSGCNSSHKDGSGYGMESRVKDLLVPECLWSTPRSPETHSGN